MDVEKARVTGRAERLNAHAASFLAGRPNDVAERLLHGPLVSRARMKTSEDEQLQASSSEGQAARRKSSTSRCWDYREAPGGLGTPSSEPSCNAGRSSGV